MSDNFEYEIKPGEDGYLIVSLKGTLTEDADDVLTELSSKLTNRVVFEMNELKHVNSSGIAEWVEFMKKFTDTRPIVFQNCSPSVVQVINMVGAFRQNAKVNSVHAPFYCECGFDALILLNLGDGITQDELAAIDVDCPKCKTKKLSPEYDLTEYLSFYFEQ